MALDAEQAATWRDAGRWHDALRDAPEEELRRVLADSTSAPGLLHGPAAAERLRLDGERRAEVLDAVAHHTVGSARWGATGRALYMADYLEPGRRFAAAERAYLAAQVPHAFDATFREVVRHRLRWALTEGLDLHPATVAMWNALR
jgi:2-amino-4-hydroxy-6-hydroxymethyldihydropteridine diphosphokinase